MTGTALRGCKTVAVCTFLFFFLIDKFKLDPVGSTVRRDDEAVYWVSKGHYEAVAVGN